MNSPRKKHIPSEINSMIQVIFIFSACKNAIEDNTDFFSRIRIYNFKTND